MIHDFDCRCRSCEPARRSYRLLLALALLATMAAAAAFLA